MAQNPARTRGPKGHTPAPLKPTLSVTIAPELDARVRRFVPEGMSLAYVVGKLLEAGLSKLGGITYQPAKG
jgi:hypothetical protein